MIGFLILFPVVWFFERNRPGVDGWNIAFCLAIPAIISIFVSVGSFIAEKPETGQLINTLQFPTVMGLCLWKIAGIPGKRAVVYGLGYLIFWAAVAVILVASGIVDAS